MHNFKKLTFAILALHFLLMFQSVSQSDVITQPVTYYHSFQLVGEEDIINWTGDVPGRNLLGKDAPVRVSFEVYIDPGRIDTEIHGRVVFDRETKTPRVEPRWTRNDVCDQFVGKFATRGGIRIGGNLVIDISIGQPFFSQKSKWDLNHDVPLSAIINPVFDIVPENIDRSWDEAAYFNSLLDGTGEPIILQPKFRDLVKFELGASAILEGVLAYFSFGASKAVDTGLTVAANVFSDDEDEQKKQKGALRTVIEKVLGNTGFNLNGGLRADLGLSNVKVGIDEESSAIEGDKMVVHTACDGTLSAELFLTLSADFFVKFEPLGVEVWTKEAEIATQDIPLTDEHQVATLNMKGTPNPIEFPLNTDAQDFTQWDLPGGASARLGKGATLDMAYSPNGDLIAVGTTTGAWLYDAQTGEEVALLRWSVPESYVSAVRFSSDGKTLATTMGNIVVLWDVATRTQKPQGPEYILGDIKSFNPDGTMVATSIRTGSRSKIFVWNVATGTEKYSFNQDVNHRSVSFSPDRRTMAGIGTRNIRYPESVVLWDVSTGEHIATLEGSRVRSTSFSPDGKTLAASADDGKIYLWDLETRTVRTVLIGHADSSSDDVRSVSFSPDGKTLASAGEDGTVRLWDLATGRQIDTLTGHIGYVNRVSFGRDSKTLASFGIQDGTVNMWDLATGLPKFTIAGYRSIDQKLNRNVIFSPDGKTLASTGSSDEAIHLWDVTSGRQRASLNGCRGVGQQILSASFGPDGTTLASAGSDHMVRLWDVATGREIAVLEHTHVRSASFSPDGKTLASLSDYEVRLRDVDAWTERAVITNGSPVYSVSFSPDKDSKILAVSGSDNTVRLWNVALSREIAVLEHTDSVWRASLSPDGKTLASVSGDGIVRLWNIVKQVEIAVLPHTATVGSVNFSPDGKTLTTADYDADSRYWVVRLWSVNTQTEIAALTGHTTGRTESVTSVIFSPDGKALASVSGGELILWDVEARREIAVHSHLGHSSVSFSPDSKTLASMGYDYGAVYLWDAATGKEKIMFTRHEVSVNSVSFSANSEMLASGGGDGTVRLWDVGTRTEIGELGGHIWDVKSVSFSPVRDSAVLASGASDGTVRLWNAAKREEIGALTGHTERVFRVVFGPNGKRLASIAGDHRTGELRLWDVEKQQEIATLTGDNWETRSASFSPVRDSKLLASGGDDGMVHLWDADTGSEIDALQAPSNSVTSVSFSPDGKTLAATGGETTDAGSNAVVYLWDVATRTRIAVIRRRGSDAILSFSPDSLTLAYAVEGSSNVRLWDIAAETEITGFTGTAYVDKVSFSPDGKTLAAAYSHVVRLWDVATRIPKITFRNRPINRNDALIFSPNGRTLITFSGDRVSWLRVPTSGAVADPTRLATDINGDGAVNVQDLVAVSAALGQTGNVDADVNGDGAVNIQDLVAVAAALAEAAAAPALIHQQDAGGLTASEVRRWIALAQGANLADPESHRGIRFLHYLSAILTPKETALLANYPNPFNPETWMPYRLAKPADVALTIYAADGDVVRALALGHQPAGVYQAKSRAAYWDGRNSRGEPVASGVYFYTLNADDFTATRKMLIRK